MNDIMIVHKYQDDFGIWNITYKYWVKGTCACTAKKIQRTFTIEPSIDDLIKAI
jgi:hypothetical protein